MTEEVYERVTEVLTHESESEVNRLMADSIRILAIYNGVSWASEVIPDLIKLSKFLGRFDVFEPEIVDEALNKLESEGVVTIEEKARGAFMYPGTFMDKFIRLVNLNETLKVLKKDQKFMSYIHERHRKIKESLGR